MFTLQTNLKQHLLKGGGVKSVEEVTVNSREENSYWDKSLKIEVFLYDVYITN